MGSDSGVGISNSQFPDPRDGALASEARPCGFPPSPVPASRGKLRLEKALDLLSSAYWGCCGKGRACVLTEHQPPPGLRVGRRAAHSGIGVSELYVGVSFPDSEENSKRGVSFSVLAVGGHSQAVLRSPHFHLCQ